MLGSAMRSFREAFEIQGELGRLVDAATSEMQLGVDWGANMQICDKVLDEPTLTTLYFDTHRPISISARPPPARVPVGAR